VQQPCRPLEMADVGAAETSARAVVDILGPVTPPTEGAGADYPSTEIQV
jgi:hypothetical protein